MQVFKATIVKKIISLFEDISYALTIYQLPANLLVCYRCHVNTMNKGCLSPLQYTYGRKIIERVTGTSSLLYSKFKLQLWLVRLIGNRFKIIHTHLKEIYGAVLENDSGCDIYSFSILLQL